MQHPTILKLGTRGSLLAIAQSRLVARDIERRWPSLSIQLATRETRGDRNQKVSLKLVDDPDFFAAELDAALLDGEVDFCVHSLKDVAGERPAGLITAAIPQRENPREVILFRPDIIDRLRQGVTLTIGTSSRRRTLNIGEFLPKALPQFDNPPRIAFADLRGPVDQRLKRVVTENQPRPNQLDGVVLALAGLQRLWADPDGRRTIQPLISELRWMVLPLSLCPAAPGQGALAIECRADDRRCRERLGALHDPLTARLVKQELDLVATEPPEQQQTFGATAVASNACGTLMWARGRRQSDSGQTETVQQTIWPAPPRPTAAVGWNGHDWGKLSRAWPLPLAVVPASLRAVFIAHSRALPKNFELPTTTRVWVSGTASWYRLAERGIWVEGCGDNLGFGDLVPTLRAGVLQLPALDQWTALTHEAAVPSWKHSGVGRVLASYRIGIEANTELRRQIGDSTHFYWGSVQQFEALQSWLPVNAQHACGTGKTLQALRLAGLDRVQPFPSRKDWQQWLG